MAQAVAPKTMALAAMTVPMGTFVRDVLGLAPLDRPDIGADTFRLQDGACFAIASPGGMGPTERSIGFFVDDLDAAVASCARLGALSMRSQPTRPSATVISSHPTADLRVDRTIGRCLVGSGRSEQGADFLRDKADEAL